MARGRTSKRSIVKGEGGNGIEKCYVFGKRCRLPSPARASWPGSDILHASRRYLLGRVGTLVYLELSPFTNIHLCGALHSNCF